MILRPHQVVDHLAPHWVSAAIAAASLAANAAQSQAQQANIRREGANAAQAAKQGTGSGQTGPGVASNVLGGAGQALGNPQIQNQLKSLFQNNNPNTTAPSALAGVNGMSMQDAFKGVDPSSLFGNGGYSF